MKTDNQVEKMCKKNAAKKKCATYLHLKIYIIATGDTTPENV